MKYAKLDEVGGVRFRAFESDSEAAKEGFLPLEEQEKPATPENVIPHNYNRAYAEVDGKIIMSWTPYPNYEAIEELKKKIDATDYKVIKCYEASLVGASMPYDVEQLHTERQEIRDEINRLEDCK